MIAAIIYQLCLGGIYAWSYFTPRLMTEYGIGLGRGQSIFGVCIFVFTVSMVAGGRLQQRYGARRLALAGACCYGGAYLGAGWLASNFVSMLLFKGVLEGIGIGLGYLCPLLMVLQWFPRRRGMATGFVIGGFGGGAIVLSNVAQFLFARGLTLSQLFVAVGIVYFILATTAASFLVPPEGHSARPEDRSAAFAIPFAGILRDLRFWFLTMAMFAGTCSGLIIIGSLHPIGSEAGLARHYTLLGIGVFSVGNSSGRLIWGILFDRFGKSTIPASLLLMGLAILLLLPSRADAPAWFILGAGLVGFAFGACFVVYATQTANYFGSSLVGSIYPAIFLAGYGVPALLGSGAGGLLHQFTGTYTSSIFVSAVISLLGAILVMVLGRGLDWRPPVANRAGS